jgi:hypothetical protein
MFSTHAGFHFFDGSVVHEELGKKATRINSVERLSSTVPRQLQSK